MPVEKRWEELYKIGGACLLIDGILLIIAFSVSLGYPAPSRAAEALAQIAQNSLLYRTVIGIFTVAAVLFTPGMLALYVSLRDVKRTHMLIATALFATAIALFLGASVVQYSLARLSTEFVASTSDAERAAFSVAWILANDASAAAETLGGFVFAVAVLVTGSVMLEGSYGKSVAYLSILTGIVGIVATITGPLIEIAVVVSNYLIGLWFIAVGYRLYALRWPRRK